MIIFILLFLSSFAFAQEIEVPDVVITGEDKSPPASGVREEEEEERFSPPPFKPFPHHPKLRLPTRKLFEMEEAPPLVPKEEEERGEEHRPKPLPLSTSSTFTFCYDTLETLSYNSTNALQTEKLSHLLTVQRMNSEGFIKEERNFDKISKDKLQINLNAPFTKWRLSATLSYFGRRLLLPYKYKGKPDVRENADLVDFSLSAQGFFSPAYELKGKFYYANSSLSHKHSELSEEERDEIFEAKFGLDTYWLEEIPFSITFSGYSSSCKEGLIGFSAESKGIEVHPLSLNLRGGIKFIRDEEKLFPDYSFSVSYPFRKLTLRAEVCSNLEDPFFPSLYAYRDYVKVNEGLRAEKTKFWSKFIGEYQLQQNSSLTISLFYKDVEDMIYWEEDEKLFSPSNADAVLQGFGVSVKYFLSKNLLQRLLFDYIHPDKVIPYFPEYKLEAGVKYLGGVNAELLIKYFGKQYPFYGKKESALSSYLILDAKFTKKLGKFITLSLSGKNLLDEDAERRRGYPLAGRVIEGGITLKF